MTSSYALNAITSIVKGSTRSHEEGRDRFIVFGGTSHRAQPSTPLPQARFPGHTLAQSCALRPVARQSEKTPCWWWVAPAH